MTEFSPVDLSPRTRLSSVPNNFFDVSNKAAFVLPRVIRQLMQMASASTLLEQFSRRVKFCTCARAVGLSSVMHVMRPKLAALRA